MGHENPRFFGVRRNLKERITINDKIQYHRERKRKQSELHREKIDRPLN